MKKGFSLIEILVVVAIFAVLGILITRSIILSVGGSRKSESTVKVRQNLDYAVGVIERQLRNANSVTSCPVSNVAVLSYVDQYGDPASFSCVNVGGGNNGSIASGSASVVTLTATDVNITQCSFSCVTGAGTNPDTVTISLRASDSNAIGVQNADVSITSQVSLRNY